MMHHIITTALAAVAALALVPGTALRSQELSWTGTIQFSQGKYLFTETTRSYSLYSSLNWQGSRARFFVGLPVVVQDSRAITYVGELPIPTGGPDSDAVARRSRGDPVPMKGGGRGTGRAMVPAGLWAAQATDPTADSVEAPGSMSVQLADPVVGGGVQLLAPRGSFLGLDLTGSVKLPVRDVESGVGTGEMDFGFGVSTATGRGKVLVFGDVGWWRYGDLPELVLKDVLSYGAGLGLLFGSRSSALLSLSGSTAVMDQASAPAEVGALFSFVVGEGKSLTVGAGLGLTESSPDVSLTVGSRIRL